MRKQTISLDELKRTMITKPLVSVIVPVYKVEAYLNRCIDSILNQSYSNLEIILIDDGSPDNSGKICEEYQVADRRVKVIHQDNSGLSGARNTGINLATGDFVTFVDSDDYIDKHYILIMLMFGLMLDVDIVQTKVAITWNENTSIKQNNLSIHYEVIDGKTAPNRRDYKVTACAKLYKSDIVKKHLFPEAMINEDDATYYRFAYESDKICIVEYDTYYYYQSSESIMRNSSKDRKTDYIQVYYDRICFYEERNEPELVARSRERFCFVLLLYYASYRRDGINHNDLPRILGIFKEQYNILNKHHGLNLNRKVVYAIFYLMPSATARIVEILIKIRKGMNRCEG